MTQILSRSKQLLWSGAFISDRGKHLYFIFAISSPKGKAVIYQSRADLMSNLPPAESIVHRAHLLPLAPSGHIHENVHSVGLLQNPITHATNVESIVRYRKVKKGQNCSPNPLKRMNKIFPPANLFSRK